MRPIFRKLCILPVLALVLSLSGRQAAQAFCTCNTNQDCYICTGGHPDSVGCLNHRCVGLPS
jgi:hypothetical protein